MSCGAGESLSMRGRTGGADCTLLGRVPLTRLVPVVERGPLSLGTPMTAEVPLPLTPPGVGPAVEKYIRDLHEYLRKSGVRDSF